MLPLLQSVPHLQDDFYILDSHLIVTETSNSVLDSKVWEAVVPQSALSWQRVLVANWLSSNGADWAHWIKKHNSGKAHLSFPNFVPHNICAVGEHTSQTLGECRIRFTAQ